jgi:glycosyltransferase involved in cell wall biosynthesis
MRRDGTIALVHGATAFGAVEEYVLAIAAGLRERGLHATLVFPDVPGLDPFRALASEETEPAPFPAAWLEANPLTTIRKLSRLLHRLEPRAIHLVDAWSVGIVAAWLARPRLRVVTHHTPALPRRDSFGGRLLWRAAWATRPLIVYTSGSDREADRRQGPSRVIPLGIELDRFDVERHPAGIVGTVGRLTRQKDQRTLLDAAPLVLEAHPGVRFAIVGEGELREELEAQARALGLGDRVAFLGHRTDIPELLATFDVFALPSLYEGLCYAVIEAQAAGVPVVATPVGGVGENVVAGETGLLCRPGDAGSLARGILTLLDDPAGAARLAAEARTRARARYSVERMIAETIGLYEAEARR